MPEDQKIDEAMAFDVGSDFVSADQDAAKPDASAPGEQDGGGMDQLRSLVLGPVTHDLQVKMTQLSQRLDGSMLELDRRTADHVSSLETRFRDRMEAMASEIAELQERQTGMLRDVREELEAGTRSLDEKMEALADRVTRERSEEVAAIRTEFEQLAGSITSRLDCEAEVLRSELVDRDSLSAALSEVAVRLSSDSTTEIIVADGMQDEIDLEAAIDAAAGKI